MWGAFDTKNIFFYKENKGEYKDKKPKYKKII